MSSSNTPKNTSRRGFLKRISQMGAALGLGIAGAVATTDSASACTPDYYEYRYPTTSCGSCAGQGSVASRRTYSQRRVCRNCTGGVKNCGGWTAGSYCAGCS
ncbi:MAG: twin-arginine translocation signal domain-containing protein [Chloroflexi bacterium]|nr:twin-arginine translocation signal domain-containing protein [Chloroflexota bacterium]